MLTKFKGLPVWKKILIMAAVSITAAALIFFVILNILWFRHVAFLKPFADKIESMEGMEGYEYTKWPDGSGEYNYTSEDFGVYVPIPKYLHLHYSLQVFLRKPNNVVGATNVSLSVNPEPVGDWLYRVSISENRVVTTVHSITTNKDMEFPVYNKFSNPDELKEQYPEEYALEEKLWEDENSKITKVFAIAKDFFGEENFK
ncbi:MAG: hypothetical protein LBR54_00930 [Oscillospiraceae bacterium]|jgi:hypothetical protein|nr:hypothetical protein [Oscillospiraceae bacterium]